MKKIIACLSLALAMVAGTTAMAAPEATYDSANNKVTVSEANAYKTVLIEDAEGTPVYIDQATDAFEATANFLIKANPGKGNYTVKLGGNGSVTTANFTVSAPVTPDPDPTPVGDPMNWTAQVADANSTTYSAGFTATAVNLDSVRKLVISATKDGVTQTAALNISQVWSTASGTVNLAVKVTNVPNEVTNLTVRFAN
jgi:hypothetical protein